MLRSLVHSLERDDGHIVVLRRSAGQVPGAALFDGCCSALETEDLSAFVADFDNAVRSEDDAIAGLQHPFSMAA